MVPVIPLLVGFMVLDSAVKLPPSLQSILIFFLFGVHTFLVFRVILSHQVFSNMSLTSGQLMKVKVGNVRK